MDFPSLMLSCVCVCVSGYRFLHHAPNNEAGEVIFAGIISLEFICEGGKILELGSDKDGDT